MKMNLIEYVYLVSYSFRTGVGRTALKRNKRINSYEDITAIEQDIGKWNEIQNVGVQSFQLLNWRFVWPFSKEPEPVVEKQPEPRPYLRQVFANGIWQRDLPADNLAALKVILGLFKSHEGNIELERSDKVDDTLMNTGMDEEGFLFSALFWLERNPGA